MPYVCQILDMHGIVSHRNLVNEFLGPVPMLNYEVLYEHHVGLQDVCSRILSLDLSISRYIFPCVQTSF